MSVETLLSQFKTEDESKLESNYTVYKNDKDYENVVDLSERTGLPKKVVENNLNQATKIAEKPDFDQFREEAPKLSELMDKDLDFFRMAKGKTEGLRKLENAYRRTGVLASTGKSLMTGLGGLVDIYGRHIQKQALKDLVGPAPMGEDEAKEIIRAFEAQPSVPMGSPLLPKPKIFGDPNLSLEEKAKRLAQEETFRRQSEWEAEQERIKSDPKAKAAQEWFQMNARKELSRGREISLSARDFSQKIRA